MYTPIEEAPPEFMQRYNAITSGQEKLDTPQKLKDFWLFAIEQGWKSYEMREYVALLTEEADWKSPLNKQFFYGPSPDHSPSLNWVHSRFRDFKAMDISPYPDEMTDEGYLDQQWSFIEEDVKNFEPKFYDKLLKTKE